MAIFVFFNDTATTEIYTLSLHDALPISGPDDAALRTHGVDEPDDRRPKPATRLRELAEDELDRPLRRAIEDRKSTRLNSSHANISYAVFCLKKKNNNHKNIRHINITCTD